MSAEWGSLPLLSLRCILDHLSTEDALAALSTCRHWRSAILLYEGRKETLKLNVKCLERNLFVTRLFKKYTRRLHVIIDTDVKDLENFMNYVLPQFFDTQTLQELVFIGPVYLQQRNILPTYNINRIITESLIFKNSHCLQRFALLGCVMAPPVINENDRYTHKNVEYYSRSLTFSAVTLADTVFSGCNAGMMAFSSLRHLIFDFDLLSTSTIVTLSHLRHVSDLTLNIGQKRPVSLPLVDWAYAKPGLRVTLIIVTVPHCMMNMIIRGVFLQGLPLFSLKVMFCGTLHVGILQRLITYKDTIREIVWVDYPGTSLDICNRVIKHHRNPNQFRMTNVNPFMLLCWQCFNLKRLVIHGYWVWQYDILGMVRLRRSLQDLEISAIYNRQTRFTSATRCDHMVRVLTTDTQKMIDPNFVHQVNSFAGFNWAPVAWECLDPALRPRSTLAQRVDYVLRESLRDAPAF